MLSSAVAASLHLLALGIGLPAVYMRGLALRRPLDDEGLKRLFAADNVWGLAGLLWIGTGLFRAFGGVEKGSWYYLHSRVFWVKMGILGVLFVLETWPMVSFIRWRIAQAKGKPFDTSAAPVFRRINDAQVVLTLSMVFVASLMARGIGF